MLKTMKKFLKDESGASLVEYVLLVALIGVVWCACFLGAGHWRGTLVWQSDLLWIGSIAGACSAGGNLLLIEAMRAGVKEFFPQPLNKEEVKRALQRLRLQQSPQQRRKAEGPTKQGKIINVIGSKGGVGTTTVAVNLATSLAYSTFLGLASATGPNGAGIGTFDLPRRGYDFGYLNQTAQVTETAVLML